jgi:hypothetical protein
MLTWVTVLIIGVLAVAGFFTWSNWDTSRTHARFQAKDVEEALAEVLSPDAPTHDSFDLFLSWPIDDPALESIRQQCLRIIKETDPPPPGQDLTDEAMKRIASLLQELRTRRDTGSDRS